jgi:hypothetical protein
MFSPTGQIVPTPKYLYKFMTSAHAEGLLTEGKIRIGTMFEYRGPQYEGNTRDEEEGLMQYRETYTGSGSNISQYLNRWISCDAQAGPGVHIENMVTETNVTEINQHIYCTSLVPDWDDVDATYDICIRISYVPAFIHILSEILARNNLANKIVAFDKVRYTGRDYNVVRTGPFNTGAPEVRPGLLKPARFSAQKEYRIIYAQKTRSELVPILDADMRLTTLCESYRRKIDRYR